MWDIGLIEGLVDFLGGLLNSINSFHGSISILQVGFKKIYSFSALHSQHHTFIISITLFIIYIYILESFHF